MGCLNRAQQLATGAQVWQHPSFLYFPIQHPSHRAGDLPVLSWRDGRGTWNLCTIAARGPSH
jgi:hypothetical protein